MKIKGFGSHYKLQLMKSKSKLNVKNNKKELLWEGGRRDSPLLAEGSYIKFEGEIRKIYSTKKKIQIISRHLQTKYFVKKKKKKKYKKKKDIEKK